MYFTLAVLQHQHKYILASILFVINRERDLGGVPHMLEITFGDSVIAPLNFFMGSCRLIVSYWHPLNDHLKILGICAMYASCTIS